MRISSLILICLILIYTVVAEKTLTKNVHMCYIGVAEGKVEK